MFFIYYCHFRGHNIRKLLLRSVRRSWHPPSRRHALVSALLPSERRRASSLPTLKIEYGQNTAVGRDVWLRAATAATTGVDHGPTASGPTTTRTGLVTLPPPGTRRAPRPRASKAMGCPTSGGHPVGTTTGYQAAGDSRAQVQILSPRLMEVVEFDTVRRNVRRLTRRAFCSWEASRKPSAKSHPRVPTALIVGESEPAYLATHSLRGSRTVMTELVFLIEDAAEGGYLARALGTSIVTEADDMPALREATRDAVRCHFNEPDLPSAIRLRFVRDEVIEA